MPAAKTPKEAPEFTKAKSSGKKADAVRAIVKAYKASKDPLVFADVCAKAGAKYPQDVEAALMALETIGQVERLEGNVDGKRRVAYRWIA
jgi:hypothetical protein